MLRRVSLLVVVLALLAPAGALAQDQSPFAPLPPASPPQQDTTSVSSSSDSGSDNGGLQDWQEILIFAGAGILLAGIAWAIVADARERAPAQESETVSASKALREEEHKRRKAQARAANKRARAARKRNR
jgi:hypothetical protein